MGVYENIATFLGLRKTVMEETISCTLQDTSVHPYF